MVVLLCLLFTFCCCPAIFGTSYHVVCAVMVGRLSPFKPKIAKNLESEIWVIGTCAVCDRSCLRFQSIRVQKSEIRDLRNSIANESDTLPDDWVSFSARSSEPKARCLPPPPSALASRPPVAVTISLYDALQLHDDSDAGDEQNINSLVSRNDQDGIAVNSVISSTSVLTDPLSQSVEGWKPALVRSCEHQLV